jgi:(R)-citramalate synthase
VNGREVEMDDLNDNGSQVPSLDEIFTPEETYRGRAALERVRAQNVYRPEFWMFSGLNRTGPEPDQKKAVSLRDITLRTTEQMPNVSLSRGQRHQLIRALAEAGVSELVLSAFRRGHTTDDVRQEVELLKGIRSDAEALYTNAVGEEDIKFARDAGIDRVGVSTAVFLGDAMPMSAGAVYHRAWQGRDWRSLNFPSDALRHADRARRIIEIGRKYDIAMTAVVNLAAFADEDYMSSFCSRVAEAGASEVCIADSTGGLGPEGSARLVRAAKEAAPGLRVVLHPHNAVGLGVANAVAAAQAGVDAVEVAINGYEVGPGGPQAALAATVIALEGMYEIQTGIDSTKLLPLAELGAELTGYGIGWNEPLVGSGARELAQADEYVMEDSFDQLIHASVTAQAVGGRRDLRISVTSGPFGVSRKLSELGIRASKDEVERVLEACMARLRTGAPVTDEDVRQSVESIRQKGLHK